MAAKLIAGALAVGSLTSQNEPLITVDTWFTPAPKYSYGKAVWYGRGVMEGTAYWRQLSLEDYLDGVALMSPADIGKTVWMRRPGHDWEGPYLVVDCAARGDMPRVAGVIGEVVEVGFETAVRWGMVNSDQTQVYKWMLRDVEIYIDNDQPGESLSDPVYYPDWWVERAEYTKRFDPHPYYMFGYGWNMRDGRILEFEDFINPRYDTVKPLRLSLSRVHRLH